MAFSECSSSTRVLCREKRDGVIQLVLNQPEKNNAFDELMIADLNKLLAQLAADDYVRVIELRGKGKHFSAGADLNWMQRAGTYSKQQNLQDAQQLAQLMQQLAFIPKPTIAIVNGAAYGGGLGLAACCDIVVATPDAYFCCSEVKLGLVPAVISPYVVAAIGSRNARRYMLSAEVISALKAQELGLVHEVISEDKLEPTLEQMTCKLLAGAPLAQGKIKELLTKVTELSIDQDLIADTTELIASVRTADEAQTRIADFFNKRAANKCKEK